MALNGLGESLKRLKSKNPFIRKSIVSGKVELNLKSFKWVAGAAVIAFVATVLFLPEEKHVQFSEQTRTTGGEIGSATQSQKPNVSNSSSAGSLWAAPKMDFARSSSNVNFNTAMAIGQKGGNAKTQLRAGLRLPLRILDKFIVSQEQVPILAESILDTVSPSGLKLPAGTRFYGEASFQKGSDRATVHFKQISLQSGQIKAIGGIAAGKDGQPGISGRVYSDGMKNVTGEVLTTFVAGLAAGSVQTDIFGRSRGGLENGLLNAVSETAKNRGQAYGEKLKSEREWIEVNAGTECDAILDDSLNLQEGGEQ